MTIHRYSYAAKFKTGCGWPSFDLCFKNAIKINLEQNKGRLRVEIQCAKCDSHLGHVFANEGYHESRNNQRQCVNSIAIKYVNTDIPSHLTEESLDLSA